MEQQAGTACEALPWAGWCPRKLPGTSHPAVADGCFTILVRTPDPNHPAPSWQDLGSHGRSSGVSRSWDFPLSTQNRAAFVQPPSTIGSPKAVSLPLKDHGLRKHLYRSEQSGDAAVRASASRKLPGTAGAGRGRGSALCMCHPEHLAFHPGLLCPLSDRAWDPRPGVPGIVPYALGRVPVATASALPHYGSLWGGASIPHLLRGQAATRVSSYRTALGRFNPKAITTS